MGNMCDVPPHLHDHNYWMREPGGSQMSTSTSVAAEGRKRRREPESGSSAFVEPPERRLRENAAVLPDRSPSPQPSTSAPQARLEGVRPEERSAGEIQPGDLLQPVDYLQHDDALSIPLWPGPFTPEPNGLSPSDFNAVVEMYMAWMTDSPYNPEM